MAINLLNNLKSKIWPPPGPVECSVEFREKFQLEANSANGLEFGNTYLPEGILINIFSNLSASDILQCSLVCKSWFNLSRSTVLWQRVYNKKRYPKKAKKLPWYVFYSYFATEYFTNLIKNGNGQLGLCKWDIALNGGRFWLVENPPQGSDPLPEEVPEFNGCSSCFVTSFDPCIKYQKINIKKNKLLNFVIKKYKPNLYASEWYAGRNDRACAYKLMIVCETDNNKWQPIPLYNMNTYYWRSGKKEETKPYLNCKSYSMKIKKGEGTSWRKAELIYKDYPENVESIYFYHEGNDLQFAQGHNGSKMAGGVLRFDFDSIKPLEEDDDADGGLKVEKLAR